MSKENLNQCSNKEAAIRGDIIFAAKESLDLLEKKITDIQEEIVATTKAMGESANNDKDLRENYGFRDLRLKATDELPKKINELKTKKLKIVEFPNKKDNLINLGDKFTIEMYFPNETCPETGKFELVGPLEVELNGTSDDFDPDAFQKISYLSPIGTAAWESSSISGNEFLYKIGNGDVRCVFLNKEDN